MSMIDDISKQVFDVFVNPKIVPSKTPKLDEFIRSGRSMERKVNDVPDKKNPISDDVAHPTGDGTFDTQFKITSDIMGMIMIRARAGTKAPPIWCAVDREEIDALIDVLIQARDRVFPT